MARGLFRKAAFGIWNGLAPKAGPKSLPYTFDFSTDGVISDDLLTENLMNEVQFVQSIYVNNRDNDVEFRIVFAITGQEIVVPANASGIWPVFAPDQTSFVATMAPQAGRIVKVQFLNVPMPLTQWGPISVTVDNVTATFTPTIAASTNNDSGSAHASSTLFNANPNGLRRIVQNPSSNINSIFINFGGQAASDAGSSIEITPGGKFDTEMGPIDLSEWTIFATAVTPYLAMEMVS